MATQGSSISGEESGSESHHSEVGEAREDFFAETTAAQLRRSERQLPPPQPVPTPTPVTHPPAKEPTPPDTPAPPTHTIVQKWYEEEGFVIMCWHVFQPGFSGLYMVDGTYVMPTNLMFMNT